MRHLTTRRLVYTLRFVLALLIVGTCGAGHPATAATYYVAAPTGPDGIAGTADDLDASDAYPGTVAKPFTTLGKGAAVAVAGDIVLIRGGVYRETLRPRNSGTVGSPITFKPYPGETPIIKRGPYLTGLTPDEVAKGEDGRKYGIYIYGRSYIVLQGLTVTDVMGWARIVYSDHIVIRDGNFTNATTPGTTGSIKFVHSDNNIVRNNVIDGGNDNLMLTHSDRNLVEGNRITSGRHALFGIRAGNFNAIRDNYFYNDLEKIGEVFDAVGVDPPDQYDCTKHNLIQGNVFAYTPSSGNSWPYEGIQYCAQEGIIRQNLFLSTVGPGIDLALYGGEAAFNTHNRIYQNVFNRTSFAGINIPQSSPYAFTDNIIKNNILTGSIFVANDTRWVWYTQTLAGKPVQVLTGRLDGFVLENNDLFSTATGEEYLITYGSRYSSAAQNPPPQAVTGFQTSYPTVFRANLQADPQFVDEANHDYHLRAGSPLIDAGAFLTKTVGAGSGMTLPVADARYFFDGFGMTDDNGQPVVGDLIQLDGDTKTARVVAIDYVNNTLTLDQALTWTDGQSVALPYSGSRPDIGAYERPQGPKLYTIAAAASTGGTIAPSGSIRVLQGGDQAFAVTADPGYHIKTVLVDGVSVGPVASYTFTNVSQDRTIAAMFEPDQPPVAKIIADPTRGAAPLTVRFDGSASEGYGSVLRYAWDFEDDGAIDSTETTASHTYASTGIYSARLTVTNDLGLVHTAKTVIVVTDPGGADCFFDDYDNVDHLARLVGAQQVESYIEVTETVVGEIQHEDPLLGQGLVALWHFNGDARDSSGNGNDGVLVNGATCTAPGKFGTPGAGFDGQGGHIAIRDPQPDTRPANNLTVSAWIRRASTDTSGSQVISMGDDYGVLVEPAGQIRFFKHVGGEVWVGVTTTDAVLNGEWHHVVAVQSAETGMAIYIDGVLKTLPKASTQNIVYAHGHELRIGRYGNDDGHQERYDFSGTMDEIAIWARALSPEEIQRVYVGSPLVGSIESKSIATQGNLTSLWAAWDETGVGTTLEVSLDGGVTWRELRNGEALRGLGLSPSSSFRYRVSLESATHLESITFVWVTEPPRLLAVALNPGPLRAKRSLSDIEPSGIGVQTIQMTFSKPVTFSPESVLSQKVVFEGGIERVTGELTPLSLAGSGTSVMTLKFDRTLVTDTWVKVTLKGDGSLHDASGQAMDGEPPSGGSGCGYLFDALLDLPTGDGVPGGDAVFYVGSLRGDFNGDGLVTDEDLDAFMAKYQAGDLDADFRGVGFFAKEPDGRITAADFDGFMSLYDAAMAEGRHLDPLPLGSPPAATGTNAAAARPRAAPVPGARSRTPPPAPPASGKTPEPKGHSAAAGGPSAATTLP